MMLNQKKKTYNVMDALQAVGQPNHIFKPGYCSNRFLLRSGKLKVKHRYAVTLTPTC